MNQNLVENHQKKYEKFEFTGSGGEYFRIWIVNLLLTIVTLGIYSAWAKVRRLRYMYGNSYLAGSSFEYHGNPIAILKSRLFIVLFLVIQHIFEKFFPTGNWVLTAALFLFSPWFIWKSLKFKLFNASYRGIRFNFKGSAGKTFGYFFLWPVLSALSLGILAPISDQRRKRYHIEESFYGATGFKFTATVKSFYKTYFKATMIFLAGLVSLFAIAIVTALALVESNTNKFDFGTLLQSKDFFSKLDQLFGEGGFMLVPIPVVFLLLIISLSQVFYVLLQRLIWSEIQLGDLRFRCDMSWSKAVYISFTNTLAILCTLGLFTPFAQIRMQKYRLNNMTLISDGSIDNFVAEQTLAPSMGDGVSDLLDIDLSV